MLKEDLDKAKDNGFINEQDIAVIDAILKIVPEEKIKKIPRGGLNKKNVKRKFESTDLDKFFIGLDLDEKQERELISILNDSNTLTHSITRDEHGTWKVIGITNENKIKKNDKAINKKIDIAIPQGEQGSVKPTYAISSSINTAPTSFIRKKGKADEIEPEIELAEHIPDFSPIPGMLYYHSTNKTQTSATIEIVRFEGQDLIDFVNDDVHALRDRTPAQLISIALQIELQLKYLYDHGVLYNDMKLDNVRVRIDEEGHPHVLVIDYGQTKIVGKGVPNLTWVSQGKTKGTPGYIAPEANYKYQVEQARIEKRNMPALEFSEKSDAFSLGIVLTCLFSEHIEFSGGNILDRIKTDATGKANTITAAAEDGETALAYDDFEPDEQNVLNVIGAHLLQMRAADKEHRPSGKQTTELLKSQLEKLGAAEAKRVAAVYDRSKKEAVKKVEPVAAPAKAEPKKEPEAPKKEPAAAPAKAEPKKGPEVPKEEPVKPVVTAPAAPKPAIQAPAPKPAPVASTSQPVVPAKPAVFSTPAAPKPTTGIRATIDQLNQNSGSPIKPRTPSFSQPKPKTSGTDTRNRSGSTTGGPVLPPQPTPFTIAGQNGDPVAAATPAAPIVPTDPIPADQITPAVVPPVAVVLNEPDAPVVNAVSTPVSVPVQAHVDPETNIPAAPVDADSMTIQVPPTPAGTRTPTTNDTPINALPGVNQTQPTTGVIGTTSDQDKEKAVQQLLNGDGNDDVDSSHATPSPRNSSVSNQGGANDSGVQTGSQNLPGDEPKQTKAPASLSPEERKELEDLLKRIEAIQQAVKAFHPTPWYQRPFRWIQDKIRPLRSRKDEVRRQFNQELEQLKAATGTRLNNNPVPLKWLNPFSKFKSTESQNHTPQDFKGALKILITRLHEAQSTFEMTLEKVDAYDGVKDADVPSPRDGVGHLSSGTGLGIGRNLTDEPVERKTINDPSDDPLAIKRRSYLVKAPDSKQASGLKKEDDRRKQLMDIAEGNAPASKGTKEKKLKKKGRAS